MLLKTTYTTFFVAMLIAFFGLAQAGDKKCRALAMSGGGDKGSYEAAVFIELVNLMEEEAYYDVMTGVSAGSMNACGLGVFAPEEADDASVFVFSLWNSLSSGDVYKFWPGGLLEGIFKKSGILDSQPLVDFVNQQTEGRTVKKKVTFALCESIGGDYQMFDYNASDTLPEFYVKSAIGSSSIPLVFPSVKKDGKVYVDGGSIWNIDIPSAVRRCKEVVDNDEDIIIDMILCGSNPPVSGPKKDLSKFSALSHYQRAQEIKSFYDTMNKVERAMSLFPQVNFRYIVSPSESLSASSNPIPLDFSKNHLNKCFDVGKKDARNAVKLGSKKYFEVVKQYRDRLLNGEGADLANMIEERVAQVEGRKTQNVSS